MYEVKKIDCDRVNDPIGKIYDGVYGYNKPYNIAHADLKGRVALITGAAGMIGFATAKLLAASGAHICIWDLVPEEVGAERVAEIVNAGGSADYYRVNIADKAECEKGVNAVIEKHGRIDIFFGNGGVNQGNRQPVYDFDEEKFPLNININLNGGTFYLSKLILPYMIKQGSGNIMFTSSVCGVTGLRKQCGFVASKFAVAAMTKAMALEYGKYNIRVNCLAPGSLPQPKAKLNFLWDTCTFDDYDSNFENPTSMVYDIAARRPAFPSEMAGLILYLASDDASYTTGQVICVDGGWTAGYSGDM